MNVYLRGRRVRLDPARAVGKGGEADVFDIGGGRALKIYKGAEHPDYAGQPEEQRLARLRLTARQEKLRAFPRQLPPGLVGPEELATDRSGQVVFGFDMRLLVDAEPLLRFADPAARAHGAGPDTVARLLTRLHQTIATAHAARFVIGDLNDLNVLVVREGPHLIDCDSFQFDRFPCDVFTERFLDPLLCDAGATTLQPARPFSTLSDWYAFTVMVMQCLLFVGPYGGVYRPRDRARLVAPGERPLRRITVFHPEVIYPRPAIPYRTLPDELLHQLHRVFEQDVREVFPRALLEELRWTRCSRCGSEHARTVCPTCASSAPAAVLEQVVIRGELIARRLVRTPGVLLWVSALGDSLHWLCHEDGVYRREDGRVVRRGPLDPHLRVRLQGEETLLGAGGRLVHIDRGGGERVLSVDSVLGEVAFDCTADHLYWIDGGRLLRDGVLGPEPVGEVLAGQTRFWVGPCFGLGFYRAGTLAVAFVFDVVRRGLNDGVRLPAMPGRLLEATATLSATRAFLFFALERAGKIRHLCLALDPQGQVLAAAEGERGAGGWLEGLRGACAAGEALFVPTDEGIARLELQGSSLVQTRLFPDTAPFVHAGSRLLLGAAGLFVVEQRQIVQLTLAHGAKEERK